MDVELPPVWVMKFYSYAPEILPSFYQLLRSPVRDFYHESILHPVVTLSKILRDFGGEWDFFPVTGSR